MENIKLKVLWSSERADDNDDNDGLEYGIYIFDCLTDDFDEEAGYGAYSILEAFWYATEDERDYEYNELN